jgi:hypothetical protein
MLETCPHCQRRVLFASEICPGCSKSRSEPPTPPKNVVVEDHVTGACEMCDVKIEGQMFPSRGIEAGVGFLCSNCNTVFCRSCFETRLKMNYWEGARICNNCQYMLKEPKAIRTKEMIEEITELQTANSHNYWIGLGACGLFTAWKFGAFDFPGGGIVFGGLMGVSAMVFFWSIMKTNPRRK